MDKRKLQWHPAFFAVLQIELGKDRNYLRFYAEYNLTRKPLQIDVLVVKEESCREIQKNIGRIFRRYNVVEYKAMKDYVNVNDFYKVMGYACIFQSNTERVMEILPPDVTVTLAGEHFPRKLSTYLRNAYDVDMEMEYPGIYYIRGLLFPVQVLVIRELSKEDNMWLSRLRSGLSLHEDIEILANAYKGMERNPLYETAMDLIIRANWETYQEVREMCDALMELFADKLEEREILGIEKGIQNGLRQGVMKGEYTKLITLVMRKVGKGQAAVKIAEDLMEPLPVIEGIYNLILHNPGISAEQIYNKLTHPGDNG